MRNLRQDHSFRAQSLILPARHESHVQTEPAEDFGIGEWTQDAQSLMHQMHQGNEQI